MLERQRREWIEGRKEERKQEVAFRGRQQLAEIRRHGMKLDTKETRADSESLQEGHEWL